jgi:hypothetical protein
MRATALSSFSALPRRFSASESLHFPRARYTKFVIASRGLLISCAIKVDLKTWMGDATPQRGGRAKRMVRVTPKGTHAAKEFYEAITKVSIDAAWASHRSGAKA